MKMSWQVQLTYKAVMWLWAYHVSGFKSVTSGSWSSGVLEKDDGELKSVSEKYTERI